MRLGLVMLDPNSTLNSLKYLREVYVSQGDTPSIMFQIVDLDTVSQNNLIGDRYIPTSNATMQISMISVNDANTLVLNVNMAFPNDDRSIWTFSLSSFQTSIAAGVNMLAVLTQGSQVNNIVGKNLLYVNPPSTFSC